MDAPADEALPTQLSSGSMSSHGRIVAPGSSAPKRWLLVSGAVLSIGAAMAVGARLGHGSSAAPGDFSTSCAVASARGRGPNVRAGGDRCTASATDPDPAPPPLSRAAPVAAPTPARSANPTSSATSRPTPRALPVPTTHCDPPYTINAAGHHVRKPECR